MKGKPTLEEVVQVLAKLQLRFSIEEIAVCVGRSAACVYKWQKGRIPSKGDWELIKRMAEGM